ncbi:MAG: DUF262 domain-containing protein [Bdellovibrionota bacterium]
MNNNELSLKPISALLSENFFIPGYQRGYRWTRRQVEDLLQDIREFQRDSELKGKEVFYCLQPVVVRETSNKNEWELIDGQQRLTTIYLILLYLKDILVLLGKTPYSLRYETREDSGVFLKAIDFTRKDDNIDYFHICDAYDAIREWFESQDGAYRINFLQTLINDDTTGKNVKVIWYNVRENIDPVDVFTRLNIGKIPLTDAELVKAIFLRSKNFKENEITLQQLKIAQEWDSIEKSLQADEFWYFINNENKYDNRIQYVLELMADERGHALDAKDDHYYTFIAFNRLVNTLDGNFEIEWKRIKNCFMTLEEWYKDRYFYHLIGFLINQNTSILDLLNWAKAGSTKRDFKFTLKKHVFEKMFSNHDYDQKRLQEIIRDEVVSWSYEEHSEKISILVPLL